MPPSFRPKRGCFSCGGFGPCLIRKASGQQTAARRHLCDIQYVKQKTQLYGPPNKRADHKPFCQCILICRAPNVFIFLVLK